MKKFLLLIFLLKIADSIIIDCEFLNDLKFRNFGQLYRCDVTRVTIVNGQDKEVEEVKGEHKFVKG